MSNKKESAIGFVGHTDTVEYTDGWKYDKFTVTKENNRLYGLGVCDMKSGISAIISAVSQIDFSKLSKGIKIYLTYDEIGFSGIKDVLKCETNFPNTIIIGEPTNNEMLVGSKGLLEYKISFKGIKTHSSNPDKGKNAIMSAIEFIKELNYFYECEIKKEKDYNFDIPYTTMNVGKIQGGTAINSVPDYCEFLVDFRMINNITEKKIIDKINILKEKYMANVFEINKISSFFNEIDGLNKTSNFITEASFLNNNRIILGAGPVTAHEVDEYIEVDSLYKLVEQYKKMIEEKCL